MMRTDIELSREVAEEFKAVILSKLFDEYWPRILKCLEECDDDLLWYQPNENTNSIGNLVLHLEGNMRQWVIHGVGGKDDVRDRGKEFDTSHRLPKSELTRKLSALKEHVLFEIGQITLEDLLEPRLIQGFKTTVLGALVHVVEHFSYHLGQITFLVKSVRNKDLGYYADRDLG